MAQQTILGRISQMAKANINAFLDDAEDPEKMMDQLIRDYRDNIGEAEQAIAQTIGNLRLLEEDAAEVEEAIGEWGGKAAAAVARADELRAAGQTAEADKLENLAKVALRKQVEFEQRLETMEPNVASQNQVVEKLKAGLEGMKLKLDELETKRDELVSRAKMAQAQSQVTAALRSVDINDPLSEVSRFEEKVRREEAKALGQTELAASSLDAQFEDLDDLADDAEVEARLAALRGGSTAALPPRAPSALPPGSDATGG